MAREVAQFPRANLHLVMKAVSGLRWGTLPSFYLRFAACVPVVRYTFLSIGFIRRLIHEHQ